MIPTDARELLTAYSEQRVTGDQVMRGLAEHKGWYVPAVFALQSLGSNTNEHAIIFSQEFEANPGQLLIFTDAVAAHRAEGHRIGVFASAYAGSRIFAALNAKYESVTVNPCSPQAESWYINREGFDLAALWGQVVELEEALRTAPGTEATYRKLAAHPGLIVVVNLENLPIDVSLPGMEGKSAIGFTAPDLYDAFMAQRSEAEKARMKRVTVPGALLFQQLQNFDMAGLILNLGPKIAAIGKAEFPLICAAA
jgi:hypothetical protein